MTRKEKDSFLISQKVFTQFIPDSVLTRTLGKITNARLYPLGRVEASSDEQYLLAKAIVPKTNRSVGFIIVLNKKDEYVASMPAWSSDRDMTKTMQVVTTMDKKYTITRAQTRKNPDGSVSEGRDIFAYSSDSKDFSLIMTDAIGDKVTEIINPIDTFSRKNKLSGDYTSGAMTLISIRDGRKSDRLSFFIHFEKNNGECNGELKGEAMIRGNNFAEYRQPGDPCVLEFRFTSTSVTLKEIEGCGSSRGLRCSFNGTYPRKKVAKPKTEKKKTTGRK